MDTIGNNIANVNTYGYKGSRTTFRDIYYQNISSAKSPNAQSGGKNASQVGYGSKVGSIDINMSRSTFSSTDQTMDVAIDGEGFFQVQDSSGNIYYTRAGLLNFDAGGNLVDMQGNYVLGVNGNPVGRAPASERIHVSLPAVTAAASSITQSINGKEYTIASSNPTKDGNISMTFTSDMTMADDVKAQAKITSSGIVVTLNANANFSSWADVNAAINAAVTEANGGTPHVAGTFTISSKEDPFAAGTLTGAQIAGADYATKLGSVTGMPNTMFGGIYPSGTTGTNFGAAFGASPAVTVFTVTGTSPSTVSMTIGGQTYTGTIAAGLTNSGKFNLYNTNGDTKDFIEMNRPASADVDLTKTPAAVGFNLATAAVTASAKSKDLGLSSMDFLMKGGTNSHEQTIADMTGIAISADGTIIGLDSVGNEVTIGRIDLATFANPSGLLQHGTTSFAQSQNSGTATLGQPGNAGVGQLVSGTLELSNVDLSREFSDMITTQRGYQANSRIITVSDTMLEELINLKR